MKTSLILFHLMFIDLFTTHSQTQNFPLPKEHILYVQEENNVFNMIIILI